MWTHLCHEVKLNPSDQKPHSCLHRGALYLGKTRVNRVSWENKTNDRKYAGLPHIYERISSYFLQEFRVLSSLTGFSFWSVRDHGLGFRSLGKFITFNEKCSSAWSALIHLQLSVFGFLLCWHILKWRAATTNLSENLSYFSQKKKILTVELKRVNVFYTFWPGRYAWRLRGQESLTESVMLKPVPNS